jgi:hypothetical protein
MDTSAPITVYVVKHVSRYPPCWVSEVPQPGHLPGLVAFPYAALWPDLSQALLEARLLPANADVRDYRVVELNVSTVRMLDASQLREAKRQLHLEATRAELLLRRAEIDARLQQLNDDTGDEVK